MYQHVDISAFRTNFKSRNRSTSGNDWVNENFIGTQFDNYSGFFWLFHGAKGEIANFLRANFQMAEDEQAVYEFIQNAADCESTQFWLFFDDQYFLAINNGHPFTSKGIEAILNIGQSHGKDKGDTIGRYGVGFKLVHRLVGRTDGLDEIVRENKGPLLFSWSRPEDLTEFLRTEFPFTGQPSEQIAAPWLLKILLTCFPAQPGESVQGLDYKPFVPFTQNEVEECRSFTARQLASVDKSELSQGSLFFLRLGEGKANTLRAETRDLINGVGVSFHFLKKLQKISLDGQSIEHSKLEWLRPAVLPPNSSEFGILGITDSKMKEWPAIIEVGYLPFRDAGDRMRLAPNFYKFFPMGDEVNGLNFVVHCNVFDHETNRRKLHNQTTNHRILEAVSRHIIQMASEAEDSQYLEIFANVLLSKPPTVSGKEWQRPYLYDPLLTFFESYSPALDSANMCIRVTSDAIVIRDTNLPLHPDDWGIQRNWFFWPNQDHDAKELIHSVKQAEKLNLKTWDLEDLLQNGQSEKIKTWLLSQWQLPNGNNVREILFQELSKISESTWNANNSSLLGRLLPLPIFFFPNVGYLSLNEILNKPDLLILQADTTQKISPILSKLGFSISEFVLGDRDFDRIVSKFIGVSDPKKHYDKIVIKLHEKISLTYFHLTLGERFDLFSCLQKIFNETKTLRDLTLFANFKGEVQPLRRLLKPQSGGVHLKAYELDVKNAFEFHQRLAEYLCTEKEVFHNVIQEFWQEIIQNQATESIASFLQFTIDCYERDELKYNRTLSNQKIIFIDEPIGWYAPGTVFFHSKIAELSVEKYRLVNRAARAILGQSLPRPELVSLLEQSPFKVANTALSSFVNNFRAATLDFAETRAIIEMFQACAEDFFAHFYVDVVNSMALISPRKDQGVQFISKDDRLIEFLNKTMPDRIKLPDELADLGKGSPMILHGGELEEWIVEILALLEELEEYAEPLALLLSSKSAAQAFFKNMQEFLLAERDIYTTEDEDIGWLNLAFNQFEGQELVNLRRKIRIQPIRGQEYTLDQATASDVFKLDGHKLQLSQLFSNDDQQEANATSQRILNNLKQTELSKEGLKLLFGAEIQEPDDAILNEYLERMPEQLENATQVAFCLLMSQRQGTQPNKKVQTISGDWIPLHGLWTLTYRPFIDQAYLFAEIYVNLDKLLKLDKDSPVFEIHKNWRLIYDFYFSEEHEQFVWFGWTEEPTPEKSLLALEYLFTLERTAPKHQLEWLIAEDFSQTLGFNPAASVWPTQYAIESESLPENVQLWVSSSPEREKFLTEIGVNTINSPLVKLRRFLTQPDIDFTVQDLLREFAFDNTLQNTLLRNTLVFLQDQVFVEKIHLDMLREIFDLIPVPKTFTDMTLLYVDSCNETGQFAHRMRTAVVDDAGFDDLTLAELAKVEVSAARLLEFFNEKNFLLFDLRCYPENWQNVPTNKVEIQDPQPDWETISAGTEWEEPFYTSWKNDERPFIYLFDGHLPEHVFCTPFLDHPIQTLHCKDFVSDGKIIYLNKNIDPIPPLASAVTQEILNPKDFEALVTERSKLELASRPSTVLNGMIFIDNEQMPVWNHLNTENQKEINDEAKRIAEIFLREKGYQVPFPLQTNYYRLLNIRNREGLPVKVLVRSAKGGNLFLAPTDWSDLSEPGALLLAVLPGAKISSLTFDDLMQSTGTINLQFPSRTFNPQSLALFAKIFHYVSGVKFVIQAPNFSASDYVQSFGLHERLNETVGAAPTNLID
jgi:hypothetical protein